MSNRELVSALNSARRYIFDDMESFLLCACPVRDGAPVLAEMDRLSIPTYRRMKRVLRKIDKALEGHST